MFEVVFTESTKGAMRVAKAYNSKSMIGGGVGYIGKKPSRAELAKRFEGEAIGGNSGDVACIGFSLDIGDISSEVDGEQRQNVYRSLFGIISEEDDQMKRFFNFLREDLQKVIAVAKEGRAIRVWRSKAPYAACGFAFLCDVLRDIDYKMTVIDLPDYKVISDHTIQRYTDWGEIYPGKFYQFLPLEREVPIQEKHFEGDIWRRLRAENGPVRALVNGKLISVPEAFYDHTLVKCIPEGEFAQGQLIGRILNEYPLGITDGWYALRIEKMIEEKKLVIVANKEADHRYSRILKSATI